MGDPAAVPAIVRHHDWLAEHRTLNDDGLIWIVQPDESGLDASPQFDAIWGSRAHGLARFVLLVHRNRALGYDLNTVEFAVEGGVPYAIDFLNPAPDAETTSVGKENFDWIVNAAAEMAAKMAQTGASPIEEYRWAQFLAGNDETTYESKASAKKNKSKA